jgi:hypothetical protein
MFPSAFPRFSPFKTGFSAYSLPEYPQLSEVCLSVSLVFRARWSQLIVKKMPISNSFHDFDQISDQNSFVETPQQFPVLLPFDALSVQLRTPIKHSSKDLGIFE